MCFNLGCQEADEELSGVSYGDKPEWYQNIFVSGALQTFMGVPALKDYASPKPGYRLGAGYTFFHTGRHSLPLYIETGHSVVSGKNPLIRIADIVPLTLNAAYEYSPLEYLSLGVFAGAGVSFSQIHHYPVVMDILTNKLAKTAGTQGAFNLGASVGANLLERSAELRLSLSCDLLLEKKRAIPLPSFQLGLRVYPGALYAYSEGRKASKEIAERVIIKEAPAPEPVIIERDILAEAPQFATLYIYFEPESAQLDVNAKAEVKKAALILQKHNDVYALFEGSTAPFGNPDGRIRLENTRILKVTEYLQKNCGILRERIIYTEPFKNRDAKKETGGIKEEHYTQFRYVKLRFVRLYLNPEEGENVYTTKGEENEK